MLSELRAEDAGEVRFQAGPAQSAAELEVEGKPLPRGPPGVGITFPGPGRLAACARDAASPTCLSRGALPGRVTEGSAPSPGEEETLS